MQMPAESDEVEIARCEMHAAIDNQDALKRSYNAGLETLDLLSAASDRTQDATDRYFDVMRKAQKSVANP